MTATERLIYPKGERVLRVPVGPFQRWCREMVEKYGDYSLAAIACQVDPSQMARWASGNCPQLMKLWRIDEVLVIEGSTRVDDLYPFDEYPGVES